MERIQVLLDPEEKERFRRLAEARQLSLSAWLREAGLKRAAEESQTSRLRSVDALRVFFAECDTRETGREPDWKEHLEVLDASRRDGAGEKPAEPPRESRPAGGQVARRTQPARKRR